MKTIGIIGAGVAGLTAGIAARRAGLQAVIFEKNGFAGGNLTGWTRRGCHIDNCIHWLTGTRPDTELYRLWCDIGVLGDGVELYRGDAFFTSRLGGEHITIWRDVARTRRDMLALSPADAPAVLRFTRAVETFADGSASKAALAGVCAYYAPLSLTALARRFVHPLLRAALTAYIAGEFSALALIAAYATFCGGNGDIPVGGSRAAAQRVADRFVSLGGELRLDTPVRRVVVSDGSATAVVTERGETVAVDGVVCACDPAVTFTRLLDRRYAPRRLHTMYRHGRTYPVYSAVHTAFSCAATAPGTVVLDVPPFDVGGELCRRLVVRSYAHEPQFAPAGRTVVQCMIPLRRPACEHWIALSNDGGAYAREKARITAETAARLTPAFADVKPLDCWTPATYRQYFGAPYGSFMGFALTRRAWLGRLPARVPRLRNVVLATQWAQPPGGLPLAARAGQTAVQLLLGQGRSAV